MKNYLIFIIPRFNNNNIRIFLLQPDWNRYLGNTYSGSLRIPLGKWCVVSIEPTAEFINLSHVIYLPIFKTGLKEIKMCSL